MHVPVPPQTVSNLQLQAVKEKGLGKKVCLKSGWLEQREADGRLKANTKFFSPKDLIAGACK